MKKIHQDNLDEKFVSRRQGFDGRLLKVMVDTVTLPNGRQTTREIIAQLLCPTAGKPRAK